MAFEIPKVNMFQQGITPTPPIGGQGGPQRTGGVQGGGLFGGSQGGSAVDKDIADAKRFFGANNGTGQLQPNKAEAGLFLLG